jgi:hypothetical protein
MAGNRKKAEASILADIEALLPGSENTQIYKDLFASMSDKQFDELMTRIEEGSVRLAVVAPNLNEKKLSIERNLKLAKEWGHNFFERIWIDEGGDVPAYLSPIPYLVVDLPLRRQAQLLVKKISIPENSKSVDDFTGQPTGASKGSKISYPELQILAALNLDSNVTEMIKFRGGDVKGFNAMNAMISKTGGVSLKAIESLGTQVKSTETLSIMLTCMHLSNSLSQ